MPLTLKRRRHNWARVGPQSDSERLLSTNKLCFGGVCSSYCWSWGTAGRSDAVVGPSLALAVLFGLWLYWGHFAYKALAFLLSFLGSLPSVELIFSLLLDGVDCAGWLQQSIGNSSWLPSIIPATLNKMYWSITARTFVFVLSLRKSQD